MNKRPLADKKPSPPPRPYPQGFVRERSTTTQFNRYVPPVKKRGK